MNPMYKNSGRKLVEGKVCWANLLPSYHYQCSPVFNRYGRIIKKVQTLTLQGITVQVYETELTSDTMHITTHKAYHEWEKLVAEGNVG